MLKKDDRRLNIEQVDAFYSGIPHRTSISTKDLVGMFAYYLTVEAGREVVLATSIDECFRACDLKPPSRTASYLSEGLALNRFVKISHGYKLHRHFKEEIKKSIGADKRTMQTNNELRTLESKMRNEVAKSFLSETIDCFEIGANRATILMCWIFAINHLIEFTIAHHLSEFNIVLAGNADGRVKIKQASKRDDFNEIPENKLLEFLKSAQIISKDVRKILEEKLGVRNSCAHPSGIIIKSSKVSEFVEDIVENVIVKYAI